jgi:hypothetical protein
MWIATASGSYILNFAKDNRGFFNMNQLSQEMTVATANHALTLGSIPFASNAQGVFSYDGKAVKEWTAKVRNTLGNFSDKEITANYTKGWIIGASSFVVDTTNEKIFDYGTSGFRFTTRTLVGDNGNSPYTVGKIAFIIEHSDAANGTINWQSKVEEGDWMPEEDVVCVYQQGEYARIETELSNDITTCHRFALSLTGLSSNIKIKSIEICVQGLAQGSISE